MDELKKLLGDELFSQMTAKLGDKELYLHNKGEKVIVDDGTLVKKDGMIPKERFDEVNNAKKDYADQVAKLSTEIEGLKKVSGDKDKLKDQLDKITADFTTLKTESEAKEKTLAKKFVLRDHLRDAGAKHVDLLEAKFDLSKIEVGDDGKIKDFENVVKPIKETYSELFGDTRRQGFDPKKGTNPPSDIYTMDEVKKMSASDVAANVEKVNKSVEYWNSQT